MADPEKLPPKMLFDADIALAGEYVLGVLDAEEQSRVEFRIAQDSVFAAEITAWRERLGPLAQAQDTAPPADAWARIDAETRTARALQPDVVMANTNRPANDNRLIWWKAATGAGFATAAALAIMLINRPTALPVDPNAIILQNPPMVAALSGDAGRAAMTASYDPGSGMMLITPVALDTGTLYPEIWLIPARGPHKGEALSLGMADMKSPKHFGVPMEMRDMIDAGATLAITPEPVGGAPGGKATGPIILKGVMTST